MTMIERDKMISYTVRDKEIRTKTDWNKELLTNTEKEKIYHYIDRATNNKYREGQRNYSRLKQRNFEMDRERHRNNKKGRKGKEIIKTKLNK